MNKRKLYPPQLLIFIFPLLFFSCKKTEIVPTENVVERFLKVPSNATPQLERIIADLRKKNEATPFIEQFVASVGYPLWQYARIVKVNPGNNYLARDGELAEILEVPVVPNLAEYVNGILAIKLDVEILYKLLEKSAYESLGFDKDPNRIMPSANDFVKKVMSYENEIWHQDIYQIKDNRLFDYWPAGTAKPESFYIRSTITPDGITVINAYEECWIPNPLNPNGVTPEESSNWGHTGMCLIWTVIIDDDPIPGWGAGNWEGWSGVGPGNGTTTGIAGWSNSDGSGAAGGSSGTSEGPCDPDFKWTRLEVRDNNQLFNPCLEEVIYFDPSDLGDISSSVQDLTNNVTNPCLLEVYNMITATGYKNKVSQMLNNFTRSTTIQVSINQSTTLPNDTYAVTYGTGGENYNIDLNVNNLPRASKEVIAGTYFHEAIHAYLKNHLSEWDFMTNSSHKQMFDSYYSDLVKSLKNLFPTLSDRNARCIIFYQMSAADDDNSTPVNQTVFEFTKRIVLNNIITRYPELDSEAAVITVAELYNEDNNSGTRNPDCQ